MPTEPDGLFPDLPEDLSALSDEDLANLLREHETATSLIDADDEKFIKGLSPEAVLAQYEQGVSQIEAIVAEQQARVEGEEEYQSQKAELAARAKAHLSESSEEGDGEGDGDGEGEEAADETVAELADQSAQEGEGGDEGGDDDGEESKEKAEPAVTADGATKTLVATAERRQITRLRLPPAPSAERTPAGSGAVLVAAAGVDGARAGQVLDRLALARAMQKTAERWGRVAKHDAGIEQRILVASATFDFPEERKLHASDWEANSQKIAEVVPNGIPGVYGLVASGGLCAPLEPIYTMPNFASRARPVRDALPSFQAERGGVNVPTATDIGDITTAISSISEANDTLGGTFATKSCQDLTCPAYTEVPVQILAHCREYGNLNAMAWPEKIAHENDLTMAAHARVAEGFLLDRIKALSINVTQAAIGAQIGAYASLVYAVTRMVSGIRYRLRMERDARFRALLPAWVPDLLAADTAFTQFDRFQAADALAASLAQHGITIGWYLDTPSTGTSQAFAAETASAIDDFPDDIQFAVFPEGAFIHVDSGSLELGIVRDSSLNSTNDHQLFGETFETVARLGSPQSALWATVDVCPNGTFPQTTAGLTC